MSTVWLSEIGGYKYKFVNEHIHERYICKICIHPSQNAYLSGCCGHNFCKYCLDKILMTSSLCPSCQNSELVTFPNIQADREIGSLHVMCTNKERGCEWQGELNDASNHLGNSDGCQFEDVKCSNECGKMLQRQYLTSHVETECPCRKVNCQYCHVKGEHQFIVAAHKEQCPKLPIACPNKCKVRKSVREAIEVHRKECPLEMVQCQYHNVGCEERMMRSKRKKHEWEKMEDHLLMTKFQLYKTEDKLVSTEAKLVSTETRLSNVEVMLHRLINNSGHSRVLINAAQWLAHLTTMATKVAGITKICPVVMKMSKFTVHKEEKMCWQSEPFFSHNRGYKMYLIVYAAGSDIGGGTHLSVALYFMKGPHDDELTWPLRETFEVTVLNQISDQEHYSGTVPNDDSSDDNTVSRVIGDDSGKGWGKAKFISNEYLHKDTPSCQYLKDDCMFLLVNTK